MLRKQMGLSFSARQARMACEALLAEKARNGELTCSVRLVTVRKNRHRDSLYGTIAHTTQNKEFQ